MSHSAPAMDKRPSTLRGATLPKWSPWAIAVGAVVLAVVIGLVGGLDSKVQWGLIAGILFVLGTYGIAARVEGRRQAKDRVATSLVWV
ncbi:phosphate ABC transporter, permease protein PstA, partial [Streptomyces mirabilis]